jgi:hypothetical protein
MQRFILDLSGVLLASGWQLPAALLALVAWAVACWLAWEDDDEDDA